MNTSGGKGIGGWRGAAAVVAASAAVGFAAIYVTQRPADNGGAARPAALEAPTAAAGSAADASPLHSSINPLSTGAMATFLFKKEPEAPGEIVFVDATGAPRKLTDWSGRVVLLNLWATWCVPRRKEMPALERLQQRLGGATFEVVALAVDRAGKDAASRFLDEIGVRGLKLYVDSTARSANALKAIGLPTTLLLDPQGREVGRLIGPAEWDSEDALRLIRAQGG